MPLPNSFLAAVVVLATATPLLSVEPEAVIAMPWGELRLLESSVELTITKPPQGKAIEIPRLNNRIGDIYLKTDAKKQPLALKPGLTTWSIQLPPRTEVGTVLVVETKEPPVVPTDSIVISAVESGDVILPAHQAVTHGKLLRFEPQPHKNCVGYWANANDWCAWKFQTDQPGSYAIHILQGCGKNQGGSEVEVIIGDAKVSFTVEDTGHFQNFKSREIGEIKIPAGQHPLEIRPTKKAAGAIMDVREVRLEKK